jgi:hypothetical protein
MIALHRPASRDIMRSRAGHAGAVTKTGRSGMLAGKAEIPGALWTRHIRSIRAKPGWIDGAGIDIFGGSAPLGEAFRCLDSMSQADRHCPVVMLTPEEE